MFSDEAWPFFLKLAQVGIGLEEVAWDPLVQLKTAFNLIANFPSVLCFESFLASLVERTQHKLNFSRGRHFRRKFCRGLRLAAGLAIFFLPEPHHQVFFCVVHHVGRFNYGVGIKKNRVLALLNTLLPQDARPLSLVYLGCIFHTPLLYLWFKGSRKGILVSHLLVFFCFKQLL